MQRALAFAPASAAEKLRATQKDAVYCNELFEQAHGTLSGLIGAERAQSWLPELQAAVALAYYGLTAGLGAPTPGEEYCDIARVRARVGLPASIARRLLCVLLCALLPLAYSHAHRRLVAAARASDEETEDWRTLALRFVAAKLERIRAAFDRLRLAFFYLGSRHLDLALPMAGIAQVRLSTAAPPASDYAALGTLSLLELAVSAAGVLRAELRAHRARRAIQQRSNTGLSPAALPGGASRADGTPARPAPRVCALCLAPRRHPTVTPCGHIFCWQCVHEWAASKPECPLCRTQLTPQSLRCLHGWE